MENLDSIDKQTLEYLKQDYEEIKKDQSKFTVWSYQKLSILTDLLLFF